MSEGRKETMKKYEIMYILKANLDEGTRTQVIAKMHDILTKNGAKITNVEEWGLRDLAYPINKENKGYYVVIKVSADDVVGINEFERLNKINPNVVRFLIVKDTQPQEATK